MSQLLTLFYLMLHDLSSLLCRLSCGTTWHAAGLLSSSRASRAHTKIAIYSNELYSRLEEETGLGTGNKERYCIAGNIGGN